MDIHTEIVCKTEVKQEISQESEIVPSTIEDGTEEISVECKHETLFVKQELKEEDTRTAALDDFGESVEVSKYHSVEEYAFKCDSCHKAFRSVSGLSAHQRVHANHRRYDCEICEKSFGQVGHLNRHRKAHFGVKPFHCKLCDKRFSQSCSLKRHQDAHLGRRTASESFR